VDLLLRPDDLKLTRVVEGGNGEIAWARYEGGSWLYAVTLHSGETVQIREGHENRAAPGERVDIAVITTHPLAAFAR